jgi:hypothetical protein
MERGQSRDCKHSDSATGQGSTKVQSVELVLSYRRNVVASCERSTHITTGVVVADMTGVTGERLIDASDRN